MKQYFWYFIIGSFIIFYIWATHFRQPITLTHQNVTITEEACSEGKECADGVVCGEGMICSGNCCIFKNPAAE